MELLSRVGDLTSAVNHSVRFAVLAALLSAADPLPCLAQATSPGAADRALIGPRPATARPWPDARSWRHIGPASFGGRVDDIEAVASDPRLIFVASASGGVFRSRNSGTTWAAVSDPFFATMSVGDIAIAPSNPRVVWAGMGEPNNRQSSTWGDGVYKSTDGGTTWRHMGLRETQTIGRIIINPHNPDIVFVAAVGHLFGPNAERGVYRTTNGGTTWQKVLSVDDNTGATDLVATPDGRTLVAAMYQRRRRAFGFAGSGPGSGIWRSTDGGDSWQKVATGLPQGEMGRIGLDVAKSNPEIMYAVIEARSAPARGTDSAAAANFVGGGVFRSADRGATWTRQSGLNPRPSYFSNIRVDPANPDHVWLGGVYLSVSRDGGKTFSSDSIAGNAHPDHHTLWINPANSDHMMLGNDGGVYFTHDGARTWAYADNLPIAQFYDIAIDNREPYWIYGGTQDNGSWAFPSATYSKGGMTSGEVMNTVYGDGFQSAVDPVDQRWVYANSQNGRLFLWDMVTREEKHIQPVPPAGGEAYRFNWNTASHVSPDDPRAYYMGAQKVLKTINRGLSWEEISPDLTKRRGRNMPVGPGFAQGSLSANDGVSAYGNITTISESPAAAGTIYAGTDDGNVQMTTDGGRQWIDLTARFPFPDTSRRAGYVSKVLASRHNARVAYAAFDGHWDDDMKPYVFRTVDGGATWRPIEGNLPSWKPVKTIAEDPRNPDVLYIGTEFGLYLTMDGGRQWTVAPGNMPPVMVTEIVVDERSGDLIVATHGRGVIILDDAVPLAAGDPATWAQDVQLFPVQSAIQVHRFREFPQSGSDEFIAPNRAAGAFITYGVKSDPPRGVDTAPGVKLSILAQDGTVVSEMAGQDTKGIHRVLWDLRYRFMYVPPPQDSGFYGPPKAAYVPPGRYTVKLTARGREMTQTVEVRQDTRGAGTPDAMQARIAMNAKGREISRAFFETAVAVHALRAQLARLDTASRGRSGRGDSLVTDMANRLTQIRARAGVVVGSFPGQLFDLLAAVESSSLPPTDAQERLIATLIANATTAVSEINAIIATGMPALHARLGQRSTTTIDAVRPPQ